MFLQPKKTFKILLAPKTQKRIRIVKIMHQKLQSNSIMNHLTDHFLFAYYVTKLFTRGVVPPLTPWNGGEEFFWSWNLTQFQSWC